MKRKNQKKIRRKKKAISNNSLPLLIVSFIQIIIKPKPISVLLLFKTALKIK